MDENIITRCALEMKSTAFRKKLFLITFLCYMAATTLQSTMFCENPVLAKIFIFVRYMSFAGAALKILLDLICQRHNDVSEKLKWSESNWLYLLVKYALIGIFALAESKMCGEQTMLYVVVFLIAARGIELNALFKYALLIHLTILAAVTAASGLDIIPDLLFDRDIVGVRHALGYVYPSVYMSFVFFCIILFMWNREKALSMKEFGALFVINYLLFVATDSKMGFLIITVLLILDICFPRIEKLWNQVGPAVKKVLSYVINLLPLWFALLTLFLCAIINTSFGQAANKLLTGRINYIVLAVQNNGIHALGNKIDWIGWGGSTDFEAISAVYNFVDNSYAQFLLNYGIIASALFLLLLIYISVTIWRSKNAKRCMLWALVLAFCFIEPRLFEINSNLLLFCGASLLFKRHIFKRGEAGTQSK